MLLNPKRFWLGLAVLLGISISFWVGSRYPALNEKAMMAAGGSIADTISMWPIFVIKTEDPYWLKIFYTTINWLNDNKKGMTFGVILGGLFLTLIGYIQIKERRSRLLDSLYGFLLGSPLGVCVNCAAPVFKGVLQSNRAELAFAMMLSSPTMNFVVLTMVFSLFPFYMAVTKVVFTLITIFIAVPLISKLLGDEHQLRDLIAVKSIDPNLGQLCQVGQPDTWLGAIWGFFRDASQNLFFIATRTVPLMFLAGFLGSLLSHSFSMDSLTQADGGWAVLVVAAIGTILPVPIAFDVVLSHALFMAGLAPALVLVLLCTLGIFSVYSYLIVWRSASGAWAKGIALTVLVLGSVIGLLGEQFHQRFYIDSNVEQFTQAMARQTPSFAAKKLPPPQASNQPAPRHRKIVSQEEAATVWQFQAAKEQQVTGKFEKLEGSELGLDSGFIYGIQDYPDPFWIGRGTASADFNHDGWPDLAFGSDRGVRVYQNLGGSFTEVAHELPKDHQVYAVAFADFNSDGFLDLFYTTFASGNFIALGSASGFVADLIAVPNGEGILTIAPAIADLDGDGYLDIFNG